MSVSPLSRAVQRSLAIIRQARQKKQQAKQYCMYYNRFGKCNRGDACPFIHDPDKVAVCTRYLINIHLHIQMSVFLGLTKFFII